MDLVDAIGQLPIDLNGSRNVASVARILENGPLLPNEDDGNTISESDFLMARRLLILLWQTYQTAAYIHLNEYGGFYRSHIFLLNLLTSMSLCNDPSNPFGNPCPHHRRDEVR